MTTRFEMEISGALGDYWKQRAEKDVAKVVAQYEAGDLIIDVKGVAIWKTNARAVPEEIAQMAQHGGLPIDVEATATLRSLQVEAALDSYRQDQENRQATVEDLSEMRNAFGEGATVVDVITGRRVRL